MQFQILAVGVLAVTICRVSGQVVFQQQRDLRDAFSAKMSHDTPIRTVVLDKLDNAELEAAERRQSRTLKHNSMGEFRFGKAVDTRLSLADGQWITVDGASAWFMRIHSASALSLNVVMENLQIPRDSELYVQSISTGEIRGPFTWRNNKPHGKFATFPMAGDTLQLELYLPAIVAVASVQPFRISSVVHGYRTHSIISPAGNSGKCNINVACDTSKQWADPVRSVVMLLTSNNQGFCSGVMLNNARRDGRQLLLTAYHCVAYSDTRSQLAMFNYQAGRCNGNRTDAPNLMTAHGLTRLAQWPESDFALLEVQEEIPASYGVFLAGWSATEETPVNTVGIHHPSADIKKISYFNGTCTDTCWSRCVRQGDNSHWRVERWHQGTTEPGSSGSPLFDGKTARVVGQLHGGLASCYRPDGFDVYGKLSYSFSKSPGGALERLDYALDPDHSGIQSMDGMPLHSAATKLVLQK